MVIVKKGVRSGVSGELHYSQRFKVCNVDNLLKDKATVFVKE